LKVGIGLVLTPRYSTQIVINSDACGLLARTATPNTLVTNYASHFNSQQDFTDTKLGESYSAAMQMAPIMIQGTSSHVGKTTIVAGLCRLFANRGLRVAPFKSQNMSLNCFATENGEEVARATAVQAAGARQTPIVHMNPLLLRPKSDEVCQFIIHGKPAMDVSAADYFLSGRLQELKLNAIRESISHLCSHYDLIVAEGAGSCAEPNLRAMDGVNMGAPAGTLSDAIFLRRKTAPTHTIEARDRS